jgi:hypothetical protein
MCKVDLARDTHTSAPSAKLASKKVALSNKFWFQFLGEYAPADFLIPVSIQFINC